MATYYFRSTGTLWNATGSWSSTASPTYTNVTTLPTITDDVIFESVSGNCAVSTTAGLCRNLTTTGYTGTITLNVNLQVLGNHIIGANTTFGGSAWYVVAGTTPTTTRTITSNGVLFPNFQLGVGGPPANILTLNDVLNVTNIKHAAANLMTTNGNSVNVNGSMTIDSGTTINWSGTTVYNLIGTGNLGSTATTANFANTININTPGTITFLANVQLRDPAVFTYVAGTVNTTASSSLLLLTNTSTAISVTSKNTSSGNEIIFNNVTAGTAGINGTTNLGSDMRIAGNLTIGAFNGYSFNNNTIYVAGNIINPTTNITNGGTSILQMSGSNNASITNTSGTPSSATGYLGRNLVINKSGGAIVTLTGSLLLNATGRTYTLTAGTFNPLTSTVSLTNAINTTFNGFNFYNLTIPGASSITSSVANTISNNLTLGSNGNIIFTGSAGWTCANLICSNTGRTITLANSSSGALYRTTTSASLTATSASRITITSDNATTRSLWTLDYGAQQALVYVNGTRIDSSLGQTIWTFDGVRTDTINWATGSRPGTSAYTFVN